jgi:hypothetical protein
MFRHRSAYLLPLIGIALSVGCATHSDRLRDVRDEFFAGNLEGALARIDRQGDRGGNDTDVLALDRAMIELAAGRPHRAEQLLRSVRDRFDYLEQADAAEHVRALVTDDNAKAYAGEDYEKILVRAMLALANLMHDGGDAAAYALQVADKQQQILQRVAAPDAPDPQLACKRVALGAYIHGVLREETHANYDDVARAYAQVVSWEPGFQLGRHDLHRATHGHHSARGHGVLYVFTFVGRGPYKEQVAAVPTSQALLIADRMLTVMGEQSLPPTIAPVKVPQVVLARTGVDNVQVSVDGQLAGSTETITDVGEFAVQQYQAVFPQVLARAVVRRIVKKGIVYAGKEAAGIDKNSLMSFAVDMGGAAWEATEAADTRCWGLLPDKIQVLRVELPAGPHRVSLVPARGPTPVGSAHAATVRVFDGRNTYVLANFPDERLVGRILASQGS